MQAESPQIVGIVGASCAGKSWLADKLGHALDGKTARLSLDDFYRDRSHLPVNRRAHANFDHPRAIDWARLEETLSQVSRGEAVSVPRYDFVTHGRMNTEELLGPARVMIVEGLWLFRRASLRRFFSLKIYIRGSKELCVERRLERDTNERGRSREQVLEQLERYTLPMFERFVAPQEKHADVVLEAPIGEEEVRKLAVRIESEISKYAVGI